MVFLVFEIFVLCHDIAQNKQKIVINIATNIPIILLPPYINRIDENVRDFVPTFSTHHHRPVRRELLGIFWEELNPD